LMVTRFTCQQSDGNNLHLREPYRQRLQLERLPVPRPRPVTMSHLLVMATSRRYRQMVANVTPVVLRHYRCCQTVNLSRYATMGQQKYGVLGALSSPPPSPSSSSSARSADESVFRTPLPVGPQPTDDATRQTTGTRLRDETPPFRQALNQLPAQQQPLPSR
jgi:hypothetical protein